MKKNGFSLIELVVAMGIVGIRAQLPFPHIARTPRPPTDRCDPHHDVRRAGASALLLPDVQLLGSHVGAGRIFDIRQGHERSSSPRRRTASPSPRRRSSRRNGNLQLAGSFDADPAGTQGATHKWGWCGQHPGMLGIDVVSRAWPSHGKMPRRSAMPA